MQACNDILHDLTVPTAIQVNYGTGQAWFIDFADKGKRSFEDTIYAYMTRGDVTIYSTHWPRSTENIHAAALYDLKDKITKFCEMKLEDITQQHIDNLTIRPRDHGMDEWD